MGRSLSGKPREEERLHRGFVGLVRLRRVHVAGEEVRFQHSRLGAQQEQRCRSWSVWGLDRQPWEGQPDHSVAGSRGGEGGKMKQRGPQLPG